MWHHAKLEVAPSGAISSLEREDDEEGQFYDDGSREENRRWRNEALGQRHRKQRANLEQGYASQSQQCMYGRTIEARFRFQNPRQLMTLEIPRANADVARRLVTAGFTRDQVQDFDNTGHVDGWEGPDIRIVSNGVDIPLLSLEDTAAVAQVRKLFPLVVAWRFHCVMHEIPAANAREVSFDENDQHIRHRKWKFFRKIGSAFGFGGPRRRAPLAADGSPAPAPQKKGIFHKIGGWFKRTWGKVKSVVKKVKNVAVTTFNKAKTAIDNGALLKPGGLSTLVGGVTSGFNEMKNITSKAVKEVGTSTANLATNFMNQVQDIQALVTSNKTTGDSALKSVVRLATGTLVSNALNTAGTMQKEKDKINAVANKEKSLLKAIPANASLGTSR